jgi:hypothetical protein
MFADTHTQRVLDLASQKAARVKLLVASVTRPSTAYGRTISASTTALRSGLSVTVAMNDQLLVLPDQCRRWRPSHWLHRRSSQHGQPKIVHCLQWREVPRSQ